MIDVETPRISIERLPQVMARTGLTRSTLLNLQRRGDFPQSFPLSGRTVGFLASDIDAWIEAKAAKRFPN